MLHFEEFSERCSDCAIVKPITRRRTIFSSTLTTYASAGAWTLLYTARVMGGRRKGFQAKLPTPVYNNGCATQVASCWELAFAFSKLDKRNWIHTEQQVPPAHAVEFRRNLMKSRVEDKWTSNMNLDKRNV